MLRNEKSDFVTISVVTSLDPPVGSADSSRSVYAALLDGLRPSLPAARSRRTSRMLCALPSASPTLLDGFTVTSRRLYLLFPLALPALLDGLSPSLLAGFTGTSQMLCVLPSALPTLLAGFACSSRRTLVRHFSADLVRHFSTDFVRHFPRLHSAALLKCL